MPGFPEGSVDLPVDDATGPAPPDTSSSPSDDLSTLTQVGAPALSPTAQTSYGNALAYGLPGLGVGLLDTLGQSFGLLHDKTVPDFLKNYTGQGENSFGDFYSRNQQPLRMGGEIAGMFLPGLAAVKVLKSVKMAREAGSLGEIFQSSRALDVILGNSATLSAAEARIAQETITGAAARGVWAGRTVALPAVNTAKRGYYAARAVDAARTTVAFELGNYAAFNSSDTFYPADYTLTDQLKWAGINLAGGIGLDFVAAKYAVRNLTQAAIAKADENQSILQKNIANVIFRPADRGVGLTQFASLQAELKQTTAISDNPLLKSNLSQDMTNIKGVLVKQLGDMAYDTHPVLPRMTLTDGQKQLGLDALDKNPTSFLWAKKLADVPEDGMGTFYDDLTQQVQKARDKYQVDTFAASSIKDPAKQKIAMDAAALAVQKVEEASNEIHYVIENDGGYSIYKNRADNWLDRNSFGSIKRQTYNTPTFVNGQNAMMKNSKLIVKGDNEVILHDNLRIEIPKAATPKDYSALYAAGSKFIAEWKPVENQVFTLTPQVDWRTTEMTLALADAKPEAKELIKLGGGFTSIDDARFHVLNEKFKEFQVLMNSTERRPLSVPNIVARMAAAKQNYTPAQILQRLNLPEPLGFQPSPVIEMFAHARLQGMKSLDEMFPVVKNSVTPNDYTSLDLMQAHLRETMDIADPKQTIPIAGRLLTQKDVRPLFVAATSTPLLSRADGMIAGLVQAKRDVQLERLSQINPKTAPLVSSVVNKIITDGAEGGELSGAGNQARAVQTLHEGMASGQGQVVYQDRINDQFPTLKAAQLIAQNTDKFVDNYVATLASAEVTPLISTMLNPKNKADLLDFNRIEQSYRHGWDIAAIEPSPTGSGVVFRLKEDSKINAALMDYHFNGADIPEGAEHYMPDMSVTALKSGHSPLVVSKQAGALGAAISKMSRQSGVENNALRVALGNHPITIRDFHLPTPELSRSGTWFVRNSSGKVIATYTGDLENSNRARALEAATKLSAAHGDAHIAVPLSDVQRDHAIFDENFFDVIDYSDQLAKSGANITGGLARTEIDTGATTLKVMVSSLQQQYLNIGIRARAAIFEPELNYARQAANVTSRDNLGNFNIFDRYVATMFSQSPNNNKGAIGGIYNKVEGGLDKALSWLSAYHSELLNTGDSAAAKSARLLLRKQSSEEEFRQFKEVLPKWNPLQDSNSWAESTFREKSAWTARPIMTKLSQVSSTLALRFLDVGSAINNFAGLLTNAPSVVYALRKQAGESQETWIARTAAWGSKIGNGDIVTFSPMRAIATSTKAYWNGELTSVMEDAAKHGYFEPEYASLAKALTTPVRGTNAKYLDDFTSAASYLADHSEIMSRKLAWGMGYKIGKDLHGFKDERNAYIYANNFVNEMIGNYSPNNKPAMFSGAIGLPLGAFQTYMFNYYRRLYGLVERQDKAALVAQYAAQAALFGGRSVPGFGAWNSYMQSNYDGSDDFYSRVDRTMSPNLGDLFLNGSLSSIPKIFGSSSGIALYSRGSVDMTNIPPTILDWQRAPPIQFLTATGKGIAATIDNIFSAEHFSVQQQEEILARFTTNRALKSIMEMAANAKTDQLGNVIEYGTRDAIHVAAALMGSQTSHTRSIQDHYNRERSVQLTQEDLRATLNDKTRSLFREGNFDVSDLQGMVRDYTKSGGNPAYLGMWFRNTFATAMTPKAQTKMEELARSGKLLEFENMLAALQQNQ